MDIQTWKNMLRRRGYQEVSIEEKGASIEYSMAGIIKARRPASQFRRMTYKTLKKEIDRELGHGMEHGEHICGCVGWRISSPKRAFMRQRSKLTMICVSLPLKPVLSFLRVSEKWRFRF